MKETAASRLVQVHAIVPTGTTERSAIVSTLRSAFSGRDLVVREINDMEHFSCTTGLSSVPTSLLFEGENRILAAIVGQVNADSVAKGLPLMTGPVPATDAGMYCEHHGRNRRLQ